MLDSIAESLPADAVSEIIIVDDNSPDDTGDIVNQHARNINNSKMHVEVIRRPSKMGLSSAILAGVRSACGDIIVVMDGDFSHPPQTIPNMIKDLRNSDFDIVVASR